MDTKDMFVTALRKLAANDEKPNLKPRGYSARANTKVSKHFSSKSRDVQALNRNWDIYSQAEVPFAAITVLSYNVAGDWKIRSDDKESKEKLEEFCYDIDFYSTLVDSVRDALIFGDAFIEKIYNTKNELSELKNRDARTIQIETDAHGNVTRYLQTVMVDNTEEEIDLKPEEMVHLQFFPKPDSPYGIALLDPSKDTILRKTLTDEGIAAAIDRHGYPKFHIILKHPPGFEEELPTPGEIDTIASDFRNINSKNEIVTTELIEIKPLDVKGVQNVEEYFNYFQSSLTCGMLVPQEVLGLGSGSTEATANVRKIMFEKNVQGFQRRLASVVEKDIFKELVSGDTKTPRVVFTDVIPENDEVLADTLKKLMPKGDPFALLTRDEIRERLGYPPYELSKKSWSKKISQFDTEIAEKKDIEDVSDLEKLLKEYEDKIHDHLRTQID